MIPVASLRTYVGLAADDATQDTLLLTLESAAVARVERWTGAVLAADAGAVQYVRGSGTSTLYVPASLGAITLVEEVHYAGAEATVLGDGTDYVRRGSTLIRLGAYAWHPGYEYHITAPVGYADGLEPALFRAAVLGLVSIGYSRRGSEDIQSESIGDYSYTRASASLGIDPAQAVLASLPRRVRF